MPAEAKTKESPHASPDVYRAIAYVMKEIGKEGISKDGRNQQQGYNFRGIDAVFNALNPILADANLCILPRMVLRTHEERATAKGGVLFYVTVQADFDFVSAADGSKHTVTMYGEAMDSGDKATNKAMSAAYKYACMQVFCIPTEGMEDADATTHAPVPKEAQRAQPKIEPSQTGRYVPDELRPVFADMAKNREAFYATRNHYHELFTQAGIANTAAKLMEAFDALPNKRKSDAENLLLDLHEALLDATKGAA